MSDPRLVVVSRGWAPQVQGSTILLANLFAEYPGPVEAIAGYTSYSKDDPAFVSPAPVSRLRWPYLLGARHDGAALRAPAAFRLAVEASVTRRLARRRPDVVMGVFPYGDWLVAAFRAARRLGVPFYAHMHDLWLENTAPGSAERRFAERWEADVLRGATRVWCMTEVQADHYRDRYGIRPELLPHTIPAADLERAPAGLSPAKLERPTVLFVGAVNESMNIDALRQLGRAADRLPDGWELLMCTSADEAALERHGIRSARLQRRYVSRAEVQRLQRESHVLVAPLSFPGKGATDDEVRTVFSTKLLEYLVAGRPIVVFAPGDSFHARSAREHGWGLVVDRDDPDALADAIRRCAEDEALAARLVAGALAEARRRASRAHAERLYAAVREDAGGA